MYSVEETTDTSRVCNKLSLLATVDLFLLYLPYSILVQLRGVV